MNEYMVTWKDFNGDKHRIVVHANDETEAEMGAIRTVKGLQVSDIEKTEEQS